MVPGYHCICLIFWWSLVTAVFASYPGCPWLPLYFMPYIQVVPSYRYICLIFRLPLVTVVFALYSSGPWLPLYLPSYSGCPWLPLYLPYIQVVTGYRCICLISRLSLVTAVFALYSGCPWLPLYLPSYSGCPWSPLYLPYIQVVSGFRCTCL